MRNPLKCFRKEYGDTIFTMPYCDMYSQFQTFCLLTQVFALHISSSRAQEVLKYLADILWQIRKYFMPLSPFMDLRHNILISTCLFTGLIVCGRGMRDRISENARTRCSRALSQQIFRSIICKHAEKQLVGSSHLSFQKGQTIHRIISFWLEHSY